jgi:hypothetical protein
MRSFFKQHILLFISILYMQSNICCNSENIEQSVSYTQKDSLDVDIPKNKQGRFSSLYKRCKEYEKLLQLNTLQNGFDSLQIRIWFHSGMASKNKMIMLKKSKKSWEGQLTSWVEDNGSENFSKFAIQNIAIENISPKSGWNKYIFKLNKFNITTLPDPINIKGIEIGGGDLKMTSFEIATQYKYRFYTYTEPDGYNKQFKELQDIENIINCTQEEFDLSNL